jgi:hypothetical protein
MLSFCIFVNEDMIYRLDMVRMNKEPLEESTYRTEGGIEIKHRRSDGAIVLVKKALDALDEDKTNRLYKALLEISEGGNYGNTKQKRK